MLKYYLFSSLRSIKRNPRFSLINITGLSLMMVLVIVLMSWLKLELSYDRFNENAGRIFRVVVDFDRSGSVDRFAHTPAPLGEVLKKGIPEISEYVRLGSMGRPLIKIGNDQFHDNIKLADPSLFNIFSFRLLSGDPETALLNPGSIVINESAAAKYFCNTDPVGNTIYLGEERRPYTITGVVMDAPVNSQIQYTFIASFAEINSNNGWGEWNYTTYILAIAENLDKAIADKLPDVVKDIPSERRFSLHIQPLLRIHLHSDLRSDLETNTDIRLIYITCTVLLLILFVSCINYMNLTTARFTVRGKEAGIRKVSGATNADLRRQFLSESFIMTIVSFIVAVMICWFIMPLIRLLDLPVDFLSLLTPGIAAVLVLIILIISLISGSYPAFVLSAVMPVTSIRSEFARSKSMSLKNLRRSLVIFQFLVSIILISCTLIAHAQMRYIRNKDIGLSPDQVIVVPIYQAEVYPRYELYKKEILGSPGIMNASAVCYFPGQQGYYQNVWWEGLDEENDHEMMSWIPVDQDFIKTLRIELCDGEDFTDVKEGVTTYILNESAVRAIGWDDPIGRQLDIVGRGTVTGVVKDFNFKSLHSAMEPVALTYYPDLFDNLMVRISAANVSETIAFLKAKWEELFPDTPFEYTFLSDDFQKMYEKERSMTRIIAFVGLLSLFISCIGLYGLVVFTLDSRVKEIGIRKVAGSTSQRIIVMLNMEFVKWIMVSLLISIPVVFYFMQRWLEGFAYRIRLGWWFFVFSGALAVIVTLLTISWHTWRIASKNPADCLRYE